MTEPRRSILQRVAEASSTVEAVGLVAGAAVQYAARAREALDAGDLDGVREDLERIRVLDLELRGRADMLEYRHGRDLSLAGSDGGAVTPRPRWWQRRVSRRG